jgi:hypothetical protein
LYYFFTTHWLFRTCSRGFGKSAVEAISFHPDRISQDDLFPYALVFSRLAGFRKTLTRFRVPPRGAMWLTNYPRNK